MVLFHLHISRTGSRILDKASSTFFMLLLLECEVFYRRDLDFYFITP